VLPEAVARRVTRLDRFPAYVYDLAGLRARAAMIRDALGGRVRLLYAAKANPDPRILTTLAPFVDGVEVSSGGELRHVREALPHAPLTFGGPGKTSEELRTAIRYGTHRFHVESPAELARLAGIVGTLAGAPGAAAGAPDDAAAVTAGARMGDASGGTGREAPARPGVDVLLRVNLPVDVPAAVLTMGGGPTPFGMDAAALDRCARVLADADGLVRLRGVHAHLASGLDAASMLSLAGQILDWARPWCAARGVEQPEINLGGGMAVDYRDPTADFAWPDYAAGLAALASRPDAAPGEILRIEPGRALTAYSGWYVTEVIDVKRTHGEWFAVLRGGTHHLRTPVAKGHDQPFTVLPRAAGAVPPARRAATRAGAGDGAGGKGRAGSEGAGEEAGDGAEVAGEPVTLVGQLCTPKDVLARGRRVDRLAPGDLVAFAMAGAYAWNISHHDFLMHPPPHFSYVDGTAEPQ
jgi:diaminopimelate decarboxylase